VEVGPGFDSLAYGFDGGHGPETGWPESFPIHPGERRCRKRLPPAGLYWSEVTGLKLPVKVPGVVAPGADRVTVTGWVAPLARLGTVQLTVGAANVQVPVVTRALTKVRPAGTV
jgi:hypothetical protein